MTVHFEKGAHTTKWLPVSSLSVVWKEAQRDFDEKHASNIAADFDPDMFGVLSVTLPNGHGIYHVIDGQHRKAAVQKLYGDSETVPCNIFDATDPARAAEMFSKINTGRKPPRTIDTFKVHVTAGHEREVAVSKIVKKCGYRISYSCEVGTIRAVNALVGVYRQFGAGTLENTLNTISETFGKDPHAVDGTIIRGYGAFLAQYAEMADRRRLIDRVEKTYSPGRLLAAAKTMHEMSRDSMAEGVKQVLRNAYNHGLRTGQLPENA